MSDLTEALKRWDENGETIQDHSTIIDAARKWADLTSPENVEKAAKSFLRESLVTNGTGKWV
jgi:hypothetical protein